MLYDKACDLHLIHF